MNYSCVWICARRDIDLPWLILLACCWCAKRASEHFLTISPFFSLPLPLSFSRRASARAHTYTYRHGMMRTSECEHLFHFIWKRERRWIKNRFIFFFSSSSSSCYKHVRSKRSDNNNSSTEKFLTTVRKKGKKKRSKI